MLSLPPTHLCIAVSTLYFMDEIKVYLSHWFSCYFPCGNIVFLSRTFFWIYNSIFIHPFIVFTAPLAGDSVRMCATSPSLIAGYLRLAQCQTCSIYSRMWWKNGYNNGLIKIIRSKLPAGNCDVVIPNTNASFLSLLLIFSSNINENSVGVKHYRLHPSVRKTH